MMRQFLSNNRRYIVAVAGTSRLYYAKKITSAEHYDQKQPLINNCEASLHN